MSHSETCPVCTGRTPHHDCAQVERDNIDLHKALAEAIKRLQHIDPMYGGGPYSPARSADLVEVLDRTSRPVA